MKVSKEQAAHIQKHGIDLRVYETGCEGAGIVHVEVEEGHFQEFYHTKSTFLYYVIEGIGTFYLNGVPAPVQSGDMIKAPPLTRIYYIGNMKMVLVTTPAWSAEYEVHVRDIEKV